MRLEEKKCWRDGWRCDVVAVTPVMPSGGRPGGKPCLRRAAEDEVGIALGLADPAVPHEGGEHSLDLREDASAFAEAGGDSGAEGVDRGGCGALVRVGFLWGCGRSTEVETVEA